MNGSGMRGGRLLLGIATFVVLGVGLVGVNVAKVAAAPATPVWNVSVSYTSPISSVTEIVCPSTKTCYGFGTNESKDPAVDVTTDGGKTWSVPKLPLGKTGIPTGISCPSTTTCYVVAKQANGSDSFIAGAAVTTNGGQTWKAQSLTGIKRLLSIACPSVTTCFAAGETSGNQSTVVGTTDGGSSWSPQTMPPGIKKVLHIACPSKRVCFAAGIHTVVTTTDGGVTWSAQSVAATSLTNLNQISCPAASTCYLLNQTGNRIFVTKDGGTIWTTQYLPIAADLLDGISCPSTSTCLLVGGRHVVTTTNGGVNWNLQRTPAGTSRMVDVSCPSTTTCFGGGSRFIGDTFVGTVTRTKNGGSSWTSGIVTSGMEALGSIACPSSSTCYSLSTDGTAGENIVTTRNSGSSWKTKGIPSESSPGSLACPSTTTCFATGVSSSTSSPAVFFTKNKGATWTVEASPAGTQSLQGIACPTIATCYAVGGSHGGQAIALVTTDGGSTWNVENIASGQFARTVACPSPTKCIATGESLIGSSVTEVAFKTTNGGSSWTVQSLPSETGDLEAIACPSTSVCYAGGDSLSTGQSEIVATTDAGTQWTAQHLPSGTGRGVFGLSCPSRSACYAVGDTTQPIGNGNGAVGSLFATTDGGAKWKVQTPPPGNHSFLGIACPSLSACFMTGGAYGRHGGVVFTK